MLTGDNGILNRAGEAKEKTERTEIIEQAKMDIMAQISENNGDIITESQFKETLYKYFSKESIPDELPDDLSPLELTTLNEKYKILASEIYNGTIKKLRPGLYDAETDDLILSWEETINPENHIINVNDGVLSRNAFNIDKQVKLVIDKSVTSITSMSGIPQLKEIVIPNTVTSLGSACFAACSNLQKINIPNSVTYIDGNTFSNCSSLEELIIPDSVTSIKTFTTYGNSSGKTQCQPFSNCNQLKNIVIGSGMTTIPYYLCFNLINLESVTIKGDITKIEGWAFFGCKKLSSINIPNSITSIGENAFSQCDELESINIPDGVTSIEGGAFMNCSKLKTITVPVGVKSINRNTFQNCTSLESITLPDGLESIGEVAFMDCIKLNELRVPNSVNSIDSGAFLHVPHVYYYGPATNSSSWGQNNLN